MKESRLIEDVKAHYGVIRTYDGDAPSRSRVKGQAAQLCARLRDFLPKVNEPRITDYAKCIEIGAFLDADAPQPGEGWEVVVDYIHRSGKPYAVLALLLSWVGPYALVRLGVDRVGADGRPVPAPYMKDEDMRQVENRSREELRKLGFQIVGEAELNLPIDVDPVIMRQSDGLLVPPPTVGKCLFFPWFVGDAALFGDAVS